MNVNTSLSSKTLRVEIVKSFVLKRASTFNDIIKVRHVFLTFIQYLLRVIAVRAIDLNFFFIIWGVSYFLQYFIFSSTIISYKMSFCTLIINSSFQWPVFNNDVLVTAIRLCCRIDHIHLSAILYVYPSICSFCPPIH